MVFNLSKRKLLDENPKDPSPLGLNVESAAGHFIS